MLKVNLAAIIAFLGAAQAMLTFLYMIANISGIQEGFFITSLILMVGGVLLGGYLFVRKQSQ
ncbi:hypothetical protein [Ekhidna sp.]|uniref:hypothetical protein n=1 Tax=Ekhidna sp. TaxID=2608089 RepID=UPI00329A0037